MSKLEAKLLQNVLRYQYHIKHDPILIDDLFYFASRKIQNFSSVDLDKPYKWAYKWNGTKCKFFVDNECFSYWEDLREIKKINVDWQIPQMESLCFQAECLQNSIVIVEVLGFKFSGKFYSTEAQTSIEFLANIRTVLANHVLKVGTRSLLVQEFQKSPMPHEFDLTLNDGLLILQNQKLHKWKYPTLDVQCLQRANQKPKFIVGNKTVVDVKHSASVNYKNNVIYEIDPDRTILRERTDRLAPASMVEFEAFVRDCSLFK